MAEDFSQITPDPNKKLFANEFNPSQDDRLLLGFFEKETQKIFSMLRRMGYTKDAIADGVIFVINQWRNRP